MRVESHHGERAALRDAALPCVWLPDPFGQRVDCPQLGHHRRPRADDALQEANVPQHRRQDPA
eukprot:8955738-Alexandrium_andersonii.AAC.1